MRSWKEKTTWKEIRVFHLDSAVFGGVDNRRHSVVAVRVTKDTMRLQATAVPAKTSLNWNNWT